MGSIVLVACAVLVVVNLNSEMVLATTRHELSIESESNKYDEENSKATPLWFSSRLGRRKRNSRDDASQQELAELWETSADSPTTVVTINESETFICKTLPGNRYYLIEGKCNKVEFVPRLGRGIESLLGEQWLRDTGEVDGRSPPFAPRLGRKLSLYSPRLGREA